MPKNIVRTCLRKLNRRGISNTFIRKYLLPEWFKDEMVINNNPFFFEVMLGLARKVGVTYKSLTNKGERLVFKTNFKKIIKAQKRRCKPIIKQ